MGALSQSGVTKTSLKYRKKQKTSHWGAQGPFPQVQEGSPPVQDTDHSEHNPPSESFLSSTDFHVFRPMQLDSSNRPRSSNNFYE